LNLFSDCNVIQNSFGPHPLMTSLQKKFKPKNTQMFFNLSHLLSVDFEFEVLPSWYVCYSDRWINWCFECFTAAVICALGFHCKYRASNSLLCSSINYNM